MEQEETTIEEKPISVEDWKTIAKQHTMKALRAMSLNDWETAFDELDEAVQTICYNHPLGDDTWRPK